MLISPSAAASRVMAARPPGAMLTFSAVYCERRPLR
jgi:hypothetical protein